MNGGSNQVFPGSELGGVKASTDTLMKITRELLAETFLGNKHCRSKPLFVLSGCLTRYP